MSTFQTIVGAVLAAAAIGTLVWLLLPFRNRLDRVRMKLTKDHGVTIRTYANTDTMGGLSRTDLLGVEPSWLADVDFHFRGGIPAEAPPQRESQWATWARRNGGEPVGWRHILMHIQATQDHTVLLRKPVVNVSRSYVAGGVVLSPFKELGGNGLMVRQFDIDLDEDPVRVDYFSDGGSSTPQFRIAKGTTEAFVVIAHAVRGRYEWSLDIPILVDGVKFVLHADDGGAPFVSVGSADVDAMWWRFDKRAWQPAEW